MIGQIITYLGTQYGLLVAPPNWQTPITINLELPTDVSKEPITFQEARRNFAQSVRYKMTYVSYLSNAADSQELRIFLTRLRGESLFVPLWTDGCELSFGETVGATAINVIDLPVRYGSTWIIANSDFSTYEIVTVTSIDPAGVIHTSAGIVNTWPAATVMYPLMLGRFDERPQPNALSDETLEVKFTIKENSAFTYRVTPITSTLSVVGSHIPAFASLPKWDMMPNYVRPLDWTEMPDVVYEHVGFLREEQQRAYDHRNQRGLEFEFYQNARADLTEVEYFWRDRRATTLPFMVPTFRGDLRLSSDVGALTPTGRLKLEPPTTGILLLEDGSGGFLIEASTGSLIPCEASFFSNPGREAQPGDPYIALIDVNNFVDPYQVSASEGAALGNNLVSYWKLDEASGTRTDSYGINNLTSNNAVASAAGKIGSAADFTAASSQYLSCASNASLQVTGDFTIACWVKFKTLPANLFAYTIVSKDIDTPANSRDYTLDYFTAASGTYGFRFYVKGGATAIVGTNTIASTGVWYFVVAWYDAATGRTHIRVNDVLTFDSTGSDTLYQSTAPFEIGARAYAGAQGYANAQIDEVGFWKRILTAQERSNLYNSGAGMSFAAITSADSTLLTATVPIASYSAATTIVSNLLLARFAEPALEWSYTTPYLATAKIKFIELPHEYASLPPALPQPAYLFIFTEGGVRTDRYTSYENSITISGGTYGGTYTPAPFSFDTVKVGLRLDQEKLDFKSFKFLGNPLNKMWPFALDAILTLEIVEVDAGSPSSATAISRFYGDIWSIESDYKATAVPFGNLFDRKFPRFLLSVSDNYTQFSLPTKLNSASFLITGTVSGTPNYTSQSLVISSASAFAKAQDYFAGGWIETGSGATFESRGILSSTPGTSPLVTLTLDRPILKAVSGQSVNMYPGYDGSIDQCDIKFSNRINFGGHPYIPNINPAVKALKPKNSTGGKKL